MNVFPRFDNEATAIPCRTSKAVLKILTDLLGVLTANLNNHSLNLDVVNRVLDLINKYIEQSSVVQHPGTSKTFSDLQTQLNDAFSETGQYMRSTIGRSNNLEKKPMEYSIPSASQRSCKDAFKKLVETAENAYSHLSDFNKCESYKHNYAPISFYEHSLNVLPNHPIIPSEQYLQNQQTNPGNLISILDNNVLPNVTYDANLEKLQYSVIPTQQKYLEKPVSMNFPHYTDYYQASKEPSFISPGYSQVPPTVYKKPFSTNMLENQSPPLEGNILHKLLQAMKLASALPISVPKTNQDKVDSIKTLPNNMVLTSIYPTTPANNQGFKIPNAVPTSNLDNPTQYPPAYGKIAPQIDPVQKFSYIPSYDYQVNILAPQQFTDNLVSNLPVGNLKPNIPNDPSDTVIPSAFQNPTINPQFNIPNPNPNDLKKISLALPAFSKPQINQGHPYQNLAPGFDNQITLQQNQINQPMQSFINNDLNQSRREVRNFTVYGKTPNLNQISSISNLKELNNVPSKTSIIELMYLLQHMVPINVSYVKYKIPYVALKNILQKNSAQSSGAQELHRELALNSEIEVSPGLRFGSKDQIARLVSTNGTFIRAMILNDTDYSVKGLTYQPEGPQNEVLKILPLKRVTRKQMPKENNQNEDLSKLLTDVQNLNSKIELNNILEREDLTTQNEVVPKTEPTNYETTTPVNSV